MCTQEIARRISNRDGLRCVFIVLIASWMIACQEYPVQVEEGLEVIYPEHHVLSFCIDAGVLFYNRGIAEEWPGGFYRIDNNLRGIWLLEEGRTDPIQLISAGRSPTANNSGEIVVYEDLGNLFKHNLKTGLNTQLTTSGGFSFPAIAHSGKYIASEWAGVYANSGLVIIGIDGSQVLTISDPDGHAWRQPTWSTDDQYIVYVRHIGEGNPELYELQISDGSHRRITANSIREERPQCSENEILCSVVDSDGRVNAWVFDRETGLGSSVTTEGGRYPSWSTDRNSIVYTRREPHLLADWNMVLWRKNLNTGSDLQITQKYSQPSK